MATKTAKATRTNNRAPSQLALEEPLRRRANAGKRRGCVERVRSETNDNFGFNADRTVRRLFTSGVMTREGPRSALQTLLQGRGYAHD